MELYSILYEFYKMMQTYALKQTTSFCAAKVNPDSPGMDLETPGFADPDTPEKRPESPKMTQKLRV